MKRFVALLMLAVGSTLFSSYVLSAPYSITYTGTIASSTISGINNGQPYTLELVFDNGGSSANSQTWAVANLTCQIWTMNTGGTVVFAQNFTQTPPYTAIGSVITNGSGALTANFSNLAAFPAGSFTTSGATLTTPIFTYADSQRAIFYTDSGVKSFQDSAGNGGVPMAFANWTNPAPFTRTCSAAAPTAKAIPSLSEWAQLMLGLMVISMLGWHWRKQQN